MRAYVAVGSNIQPLKHVFAGLRALHARVGIVDLSPFWWTPPLARPEQPPFLNGVAAIETEAPPAGLVRLLRDIEHQQGRARTADRHAPRTLDLDLILYEEHTGPGLPDPHIRRRRFLACGLLALDPHVRLPDGRGPLTDPGGMAMREEPLVTMAALANPSNPGAG